MHFLHVNPAQRGRVGHLLTDLTGKAQTWIQMFPLCELCTSKRYAGQRCRKSTLCHRSATTMTAFVSELFLCKLFFRTSAHICQHVGHLRQDLDAYKLHNCGEAAHRRDRPRSLDAQAMLRAVQSCNFDRGEAEVVQPVHLAERQACHSRGGASEVKTARRSRTDLVARRVTGARGVPSHGQEDGRRGSCNH